jgi:hypothetical protein
MVGKVRDREEAWSCCQIDGGDVHTLRHLVGFLNEFYHLSTAARLFIPGRSGLRKMRIGALHQGFSFSDGTAFPGLMIRVQR